MRRFIPGSSLIRPRAAGPPSCRHPGGTPVTGDRRLLVHAHIYKNAGSSIDLILQRCFGAAWVSVDSANPDDCLRSTDLRRLMRQHPDMAALSSHSTYLMWPNLVPEALPIVLLRHPIDRALSVYDFARRDPSQPDHAHARTSFRDYVAWALTSRDGGVVIRNYQVIHLSEAPFRASHTWLAEATMPDLRHARSLLAAWPAFGLVRQFRRSMLRFERAYAPHLPGLRLGDVHENASPVGFATEQAAIAAALEMLGPGLFDELCGANELDLDLYRCAVARFDRHDAKDSEAGGSLLPAAAMEQVLDHAG
jgi:hypothetical protein